MSSGNFDCGALLESKVKMDEVWADAQANVDYIAYVDALLTLKANQRGATFPDLTDPNKDRKVKVNWLTDCETGEVSDCADECTINGEEIGDNCKDYELTLCKNIEWKIGRKKYRTSIWSKEEVAARAMLSKMKQIDEYITQTVVAKLDTFAALATNQYVPSQFTQGGGNTSIPAAYWTPNLMGYLYEASIRNKMTGGYLLSGSNLFQMDWAAQAQAGNANGSGDAGKMKQFPKYFDLFNLDSVLGAKKTFMIKPSAVAFVSKNYYTNSTPEFVGGSTGLNIYSIASKNLPFITYDVIHTVECSGNEFYDKFRLSFKGDLFLNPASCSGEMNGILSFVCA